MRIHLLSDLHLEDADFVPPQTDVRVVVLAGDIDHGSRGWSGRADRFRIAIVYVAGNHEFYGSHWDGLIDECRQAAGTGRRKPLPTTADSRVLI